MNISRKIMQCAAAVLMLYSCGTKVADAEYPVQKIYLPAAVSSPVYLIDKAEENAGATPTEGAPYKFLIDYDEWTFSVPLSVYRSGVDSKGKVSVGVYMDDDIVYDLILAGELASNMEIIPVDLRECTEKVVIPDGASSVSFNVVIDLDYLMDNMNRGRQLAFGVSIDTQDRELNEDYSRLVVVIDTSIFNNI